MKEVALESALLFTPGRSSYVSSGANGTFDLNLTPASTSRAVVAEHIFDEDFHTVALFAGGYPGVAQNWPAEHIPAVGNREANQQAMPLKVRLQKAGWSPEQVAERVKEQGDSNHSLDDVLKSIEQGLLDPNDFHSISAVHGIQLVTGKLHGIRFRDIFTKYLDVDRRRIVGAGMHDPYGTLATEFHAKETAAKALTKEYVAIGITRYVLQNVRPGEIDDLREATERFATIASRLTP